MNPDLLNSFRRIGSIFLVVFIILLAAALLFTNIYTVSEQQQAVVLQFGKAIGTHSAGLHFKIPFIQTVKKVDMTTKIMEIGYHSDSANYEITETVDSEAFMITKDYNFVNVDFYVEWRVSDPTKFLYAAREPEVLLRNILQSEARAVVSSYNVDDVLTTAKGEIQAKVKDNVITKITDYDIGITVSNIAIQDTEPPTAEVISAFKDVENAKQHKETEINSAKAYANQELPNARAEADKIVKEAEAIKESRINEAKGQVARFNEMFSEYTRNKEITKTRIYLEAMEKILPGVKVYIDNGSDSPLKILNME